VQCQGPTYLGWFVDDVAITIGNWTTIAEPTQHELLIQNKPAGFYYYRVAGLFNNAQVQRAVSPWSSTVNVRVGPPPAAAAPRPPAPPATLQDTVRGINPVLNDNLSTLLNAANGAVTTVQETAGGAVAQAEQAASSASAAAGEAASQGTAAASQAAGTATTTVNNTVGQVVDVNSSSSAPATPSLKP
jgi:hypothetical protein